MVGGDLNGHVGEHRVNLKGAYGLGYGEKTKKMV